MSNRPKLQHSTGGSRSADRDGGRSNPLLKWVIGGIVALVAVAVAVAFLASGDADQRDRDSLVLQVSDVTLAGAALPVFEQSQGDPALGTQAPAFAATTFDGTEVSVQPGDGTAKVIGFFAHWCPHCQRELPRISNWLAGNTLPAGVEVIAVSTAVSADRPNYPPSAWFSDERWPATVVRDSAENEIGAAYGLRSFPYIVVVDASGRVFTRLSGELSDANGELSDANWESLIAAAAATAG